jgi:GNAT superfamily N-acetyltransferase
MHTVTVARMSEVPVGFKPRMREMTIGPVAWGLWSLTFHDGSTWAVLAFDGQPAAENLIGWGALTLEYDALPMIGVYVGPGHTGRGVGSLLCTTLLRSLLASGDLEPGATIVAAVGRWPKYYELAESCGVVCTEWL